LPGRTEKNHQEFQSCSGKRNYRWENEEDVNTYWMTLRKIKVIGICKMKH